MSTPRFTLLIISSLLSLIWSFADISIKNEESLIKDSFTSEQNSSASNYVTKDFNGSSLMESASLTENIIEDANESGGKDYQITLSGSEGNASGKNNTDTEETYGPGIRNETEFTSNIDENDSLIESLKITSLASLDKDSLEMTEIKNEITLLREGFSEKVAREAEPDRIFVYALIVLWFPVIGWLLYQYKREDQLKHQLFENGSNNINEQIKKIPVLTEIEAFFSSRVKSSDTYSGEMSESPQSSEFELLQKKLEEILNSFSTLKKTLDEKDRDIRQLRKGIDAEIYKGMIKKFIRLEEVFHQEINALSEDETKTKEILIDMCEILQDTFFDCGVEEFSPKVGESIRTAFGTDDNYELVETEEDSLHLQIAEVKKSGYFLNSANGKKCLKESKVKVFVKKKNGEDKNE